MGITFFDDAGADLGCGSPIPLLSVPSQDILSTRVLYTIVNGKDAYRSNEASRALTR